MLSYYAKEVNNNPYFNAIFYKRKSQEIISVTVKCYGNDWYGNDDPNLQDGLTSSEGDV